MDRTLLLPKFQRRKAEWSNKKALDEDQGAWAPLLAQTFMVTLGTGLWKYGVLGLDPAALNHVSWASHLFMPLQ